VVLCSAALCAAAFPNHGVAAAKQTPWQRVSSEGRRALSPEIAVAPDGSINLIWLDKGATADRPAPKPRKPGEHSHRSSADLFFSRSDDGGQSWSEPVRVNGTPGVVWGFAVSKPRIAVGESGTIHVFYPGNEKSPVTGFDVVTARYARSTDKGHSFEPARTINRPGGLDRREMLGEGLAATYSFGTMGIGPDGSIHTVWQDISAMEGMEDGADAVAAVSLDDGKTFQPERVVVAGADVCPCCQLTVAFAEDVVYLGYRKLYADGRDSTVARSTDNGASFSAEARLPFQRWDIDGCPLKPTEIAVDGDRVYAAAYTGREDPPGVYFSRSGDGGKTFSGRVQVHPGAAYADAPQVNVAPNGHALVVWQAKTDGPRRLYIAGSGDGGQSLSTPRELSTPEGNSAYPATAIAADGTLDVAGQQEGEEVFVTAVRPEAERTAWR
jgi:hypothetical protein